MNSSTPQKILAGRRIAIPKEMFTKSQMTDGGIVLISQNEDGSIRITPAEVRPKNLPQ